MNENIRSPVTISSESILVTSEDFQTFALSQQAQMKELIQLQKYQFSLDVGIFIAFLVLIFFSGINQIRA